MSSFRMNFAIPLVVVMLATGIHTAILSDLNNRILGGQESSTEKYPHVAHLWTFNNLGEYYYDCGATIIDEKHLLTAAHCVDHVEENDYVYVIAGATDLCDEMLGMLHHGQKSLGETIYIHPRYDPERLHNNLAIIKLDYPLYFKKNINSVNISSEEPKVGDECQLAGWGLTLNDKDIKGFPIDPFQPFEKSPCVLREAKVQVVDSKCENCYEIDEKTEFYAGYDGSKPFDSAKDANACWGDEGTPLLLGGELVGITSYSGYCSPAWKTPTVFSKVSAYKKWISHILDSEGGEFAKVINLHPEHHHY